MTSHFGKSYTDKQSKQRTEQDQHAVQQANHLLFKPSQWDESHEAHVPQDLSTALLGSVRLQAYLMADYLDHTDASEHASIEGLLSTNTLEQLKDFAAHYDEITTAS